MELEDIDVFVVPKGGVNTIPDGTSQRCLIIEINPDNSVETACYRDVLGEVNISPWRINIQKILEVAQTNKVVLNPNEANLLHVSSQAVREVIPYVDESSYPIRTTKKLIEHHFSTHPEMQKLSRKVSGLRHSYMQGDQGKIIELESKDECRVTWRNAPPGQDVFLNFPTNTSAAYVVVPTDDNFYAIYYIKKGANETAEKVAHDNDASLFEPFKLSHRGLSKDELSELSDTYGHVHVADTKHVLGKGGFGLVKRSYSISPTQDRQNQATKSQRLSTQKIQTKLQGRDADVRALQSEASTAEDLSVGSDKIAVTKNKGYFHMDMLGVPLAHAVRDSTIEQKVDLSIKALHETDAMHTGSGSKKGNRYAHRDIKLANFLVNLSDGRVRLIDFGLTTGNLTDKTEKLGGTIFYAPLDQALINEHLAKKQPSQEINQASDSSQSNDIDSNELISEAWDDETDPLATLKRSDDPIPVEADNKALDWQVHLRPGGPCLTENYLEDDKVAMLRTIYCNPEPKPTDIELSIFDTESFLQLPAPIQAILDTTTIAPLLTEERRSETLAFFEAVLIAYQEEPNLSDEAYEQRILEIRDHPDLQYELIDSYVHKSRSQSPTTDISDMTDESLISQSSSLDKDFDDELDEPLNKPIKEKPIPGLRAQTFTEKAASFFRFKKSVHSIIPINDKAENDELESKDPLKFKKR